MKVSRFARLASFLAVVALVMSVLCFLPAKKVEAGTRGYDGAYTYEMLDDGTVSIYWYDSAQSGYEGYLLDLVVPSTLGGYKVTKIGNEVYNGLNIFKSVVIPEGITEIGERAFRYNSECLTISFPSTLKRIEALAFSNNMMSEARLPKGLQYIGSGAFDLCFLCDVYYYEGTQVESNSFNGCKSVTVLSGGGSTPTPTKKTNTPTPTKKTSTPTPTKKTSTPTPTKKVNTPTPTRKINTPTPTRRINTPTPTRKINTPTPTRKVNTPTKAPSKAPTKNPTKTPTKTPSKSPTKAPTKAPTKVPTKAPTKTPSNAPTKVPTKAPTKTPSKTPTKVPTKAPTKVPTKTPTKAPTKAPTEAPSFEDFVERLYTVALNRKSDPDGKIFWVKKVVDDGATGADCARYFLLDAPEFMNRGLSNDDFVETLYKTFFDRASDPAGKKGWVDALKNKKMTRAEVVENFIESTEWCNVCANYGVKSGAKYHKATTPSRNALEFATRLYTCCLKRDPEPNGLKYWALALTNLEQTGCSAAKAFFTDKEFIGLKTSNAEYVKRLYTTFMGREPDASEMTYWVGQIQSGKQSRNEVLAFFGQSAEFTKICKQYGIERGTI